jgi:hypothetical protein
MNMRTTIVTPATALAVALAVTLAHADDSIWDSIPADRTAVIALVAPALLEAPAIKALDDAGGLRELTVHLSQIEDATGFNIVRDLQQLVIAKRGDHKEDDLVFVQGRFDRSVLLGAIAQIPGYHHAMYNNVAIHTWQDLKENRNKSGAFLADDLIIVGAEKTVKAAIDARAKPGTGFIADPPSAKALASINHEYAVWIISRDFAKPGTPLHNRISPVLLTLDLSQSFALNLTAEAGDKFSAKLLNGFASGAVALGKLAHDKPEMQLLAHNASVTQTGNTVTLSVNIPNDKFTAWLMQKANVKPVQQ